jgi:hypothetical protein
MSSSWRNSPSLAVLVRIATKMLIATPHANVQAECLGDLRKACKVVNDWLSSLRAVMQTVSREKDRLQYTDKMVKFDIVGIEAYDLDIDWNYSEESQVAADFVHWSLILRQHYAGSDRVNYGSRRVHMAVRRQRQLASRLFPILGKVTLATPDVIFEALISTSHLSGFRRIRK